MINRFLYKNQQIRKIVTYVKDDFLLKIKQKCPLKELNLCKKYCMGNCSYTKRELKNINIQNLASQEKLTVNLSKTQK